MMIWTSKVISDTQHLRLDQFGAWSRIRMAMWRNGGSLPNDDEQLGRIAGGLTPSQWRKISGPVLALFTIDGDRISDIELEKSLKKTIDLVAKRRAAGSEGGKAKSLKDKDRDLANATDLLEQTSKQNAAVAPETQTQTKKDDSSLRSESAPAVPAFTDVEHELWVEGKLILIQLGVDGKLAGKMIGRWLKDAKDDHARVYDAIKRARMERTLDPIPWITAALKVATPPRPQRTDPWAEGVARAIGSRTAPHRADDGNVIDADFAVVQGGVQ
jgi:uncharacterized protein YdaU (DUF1376 family)